MARGKPKPRKGAGMLAWRSRQKEGAIMEPETFKAIVKERQKAGFSKEKAEKMAGKAYWQAAKKKYQERKGK